MQPQIDPTTWTRLAELLKTYGPYALTVIFIFYMPWRSFQNLKTASQKDHDYFRKVHTSVVVTTYALIIASVFAWWYTNFSYGQKVYIRGVVSDLKEQPLVPQKPDDPPKVVQQIIPVSKDVEFYVRRKDEDTSLEEGTYSLDWVLLPHSNLKTVAFRFQQVYRIFTQPKPTLELLPNDLPHTEGHPLEQIFTVNLQDIQYSPGGLIQLKYRPASDDPIQKIGQMILVMQDGGTLLLPWVKEHAIDRNVFPDKAEKDAELFWFFPSIAFASPSKGEPIFAADGTYAAQDGRALRQRLANSSLETQVWAIRILVQEGSRSYKFIGDSLEKFEGETLDKGLLISNLGRAVEQIEVAGQAAPPDLYLKLALAFCGIQDFKSAARYFNKAGEAPLSKDDYYFLRGVAYAENGEYRKAIADYQIFLTKDKRAHSQAITRDNLGNAYSELKDYDSAIKQYKEAMRIDPKVPSTYNNLAMLYADRGENLQEALSLVNRALSLKPDSPWFKDTRGWILYKMGKRDDGLALLKEAAAALPYNADVQKHLEVAQGSSKP
jgi:tetratricopeptide (TPR) repeat protein